MIRITAPIVSEFAHVNTLNGPDFGLRIHWVAIAATIMATHMAAIGWLLKKFFIAGNSRSQRRFHPLAHSWARIANLPMHVDGIRAVHVVNAPGRQIEAYFVRLADQRKNAASRGIGRGIRHGDALGHGGELDRRRRILSRTDAHHTAIPTRSL